MVSKRSHLAESYIIRLLDTTAVAVVSKSQMMYDSARLGELAAHHTLLQQSVSRKKFNAYCIRRLATLFWSARASPAPLQKRDRRSRGSHENVFEDEKKRRKLDLLFFSQTLN